MRTEIKLNQVEINSHHTRIDHAEVLILQLSENHDGRNTWLLNYGKSEQAVELRKVRSLKWNETTESCETTGGNLKEEEVVYITQVELPIPSVLAIDTNVIPNGTELKQTENKEFYIINKVWCFPSNIVENNPQWFKRRGGFGDNNKDVEFAPLEEKSFIEKATEEHEKRYNEGMVNEVFMFGESNTLKEQKKELIEDLFNHGEARLKSYNTEEEKDYKAGTTHLDISCLNGEQMRDLKEACQKIKGDFKFLVTEKTPSGMSVTSIPIFTNKQ